MPQRSILRPLALACLWGHGLSHAAQQCEGPPGRDPQDFQILGDGTQVLDKKHQLIWQRCIENQQWNGSSCVARDPSEVNPGPRLSFAQAQALAAAQWTREQAWRMPNAKELKTLREPGCYNPSMSLTLFPTQPAWSGDGSFWTSTPEGNGYSVISAIGQSDGWAGKDEANQHHLRLVRTAPKPAPKPNAARP